MDLPALEASIADKVAALRDPASYPGREEPIAALETHMSWVFLSPSHAWKLKKPVCYDQLDFRTVEARLFFCREELRLNRRLAPTVYLDVVPLTREADGRLRVCGAGTAVDWLVKMRRLPCEHMLDTLLAAGRATPAQMREVAAVLCGFYRQQPRAPLDGRGYVELLLRHIDDAERELADPAWGLPAQRIRALGAALRGLVRAHPGEFAARVAAGRVVDGHGDLRPEHVWLGEPLAVIDCLEFAAELRLQDSADEVAFLGLECERAHAAPLARALLDAYRQGSGDTAPAWLLHFYQACRACARARLAIAHLHEQRYRDSSKWRWRTLRYLALARRHLHAATVTAPSAP